LHANVTKISIIMDPWKKDENQSSKGAKSSSRMPHKKRKRKKDLVERERESVLQSYLDVESMPQGLKFFNKAAREGRESVLQSYLDFL